MKKTHLSIATFCICFLLFSGCSSPEVSEGEESEYAFIDKAFNRADTLYRNVVKNHPDPNKMLRSIENDGSVHYASREDWTSGFFPGSLWFLYEHSKDEFWLSNAQKWTENLEPIKNKRTTHDIGFMINCSYGNGYRLTQEPKYLEVINQASTTLIKRFNPTVGCIKSWDKKKFSAKWQYPVIIDNMMNLEMLMFSFDQTKDSSFYNVATSHANTTIKNHFREDFSSYHVIDYDSLTGTVIQKNTHQGLYDHSSWARGQTWGLYGYTFMYRETKDPNYLEQAKNIASYIMNHPSIPEDNVPLWDYMDTTTNAPRDASAAALTASALLDLQSFVDPTLAKKYMDYSTDILRVLASPEYLNTPGNNHDFILNHATGNYPRDSEIDKPLNYADYYFLEALTKLKRIINK